MKIGLIDVDGHGWPNIPLMKISSYYKAKGDDVEWYSPFYFYDRVYLSKVFSFSKDYEWPIHAREVFRGGTGYAISMKDGREIYRKSLDRPLPPEVEHCFPDYSLYPQTKAAYGFLTRGCPRGCFFCHVAGKEGNRSRKVADLEEFWNGQKEIKLLDPNLLACPDREELLIQLRDSGATVDFTQGVDARLLTEDLAELLTGIKTKTIHFAWDRFEDGSVILPKLRMFKEIAGYDYRKLAVYVLCNFDTTLEQDLERVTVLRDLGYSPYVMIYDKENTNVSDPVRKMQRWVNSRPIFRSVPTFQEYCSSARNGKK